MKLVNKDQALKLKKLGFDRKCLFRQYTKEPFIQSLRMDYDVKPYDIVLFKNGDNHVDLAIPDYDSVIEWFVEKGYITEIQCHGKDDFSYNIYKDRGGYLIRASGKFNSYQDMQDSLIDDLINSYVGQISDGYHTFDELYEFRMMYNALLFNEWASKGLYNVHKSYRHYDGELCFGEDKWFIVVAELPTGPISNHYKKEYWDLFKVPEVERSTTPYDGHTPQDTIERMNKFLRSEI